LRIIYFVIAFSSCIYQPIYSFPITLSFLTTVNTLQSRSGSLLEIIPYRPTNTFMDTFTALSIFFFFNFIFVCFFLANAYPLGRLASSLSNKLKIVLLFWPQVLDWSPAH